MFKHFKYGFFLVGLLLCCLFIGYYSGYYQGKRTGAEEARVQNTGYNKTIAIVNLDEGTGEQGEGENYGVRLIDTITDDVVITGLEDARRGIENGAYSAYMVIPAAFSAQVASITAKPVKSEITYALGSGLAGEERESVIYRMESIFQLFSNNLSKVYLSSVLAAYHKAQDSAVSIISNDTKDMELLLQVKGEDLIEYVEIPEATMVERPVFSLDLSGNYGENVQTVQEIQKAYQGFNAAGKAAVEEIKQEFDQTEETVQELQGELLLMEQTMESFADSPWDDSEKAAEEDAVYQAGKKALTGVPDEEGNGTEGILTAYNRSIQGNQELLLCDFLEKLRQDAPNLPAKDMEETYIKEFLERQTAFPLIDTGAVEQKIDALIQTAEESRTLRNEEIENRRGIWGEIRERMKTMQVSYEEVNASHEETKTALDSFDISTFIDEAEVNEYLLQIEERLRDVERKVEEQIADYEAYVSDVYEATDQDIHSFEEEILRGQEQSEIKLFQGLEEAKSSREKNNENNLRLLNGLITQMSYTRLGEVENREVYDFIAEPILTSNQTKTQKISQKEEKMKPEALVSLTVFGVFLLVLGSAQIVFQRSKRVTAVDSQIVIIQRKEANPDVEIGLRSTGRRVKDID